MRKIVWLLVSALLLVVLVAGAAAQSTFDATILTWEYIQGTEDGRLERLTSKGEPEVLVEFPAGVFDRRAMQCSQDFWAAAGQSVVLFTGAERGQIAIYPLAGGDAVALGDEVHRMACAGPSTFQITPDGQRAGYINYKYKFEDAEFPAGDFLLFEAATGAQLANFDWTTAFALYDDGVLLVRLFPGGKDYATEGDLDWWDGAGRRTLATLEPVYPSGTEDVECELTSGAAVRMGDNAYMLVGQKCENGAQNWRLVTVPMAGGQVAEIALGEPMGGFFPESSTTQLLPAQDGSGLLMAVPSGLARNTASLFWVGVDGSVAPVLDGHHVLTDRFGERLSEARHTMVSMDGGVIAFVTVTGNGEQSLYMLSLASVGGEPVLLQEEGAGQRVFQYHWAADNQLFYAAGSIESSSLHLATLDGSNQRLARGRFFRIATSYNGDMVAAAEWMDNPERIGDDLFKLSLVSANGEQSDFKLGGQEHDQFIPLAVQ